ncbi:hypothetical protein GCM10010967_32960 [Dyadobacter beijingensis]|uniref:POTRA domain-containing protein n=1 Tax=Dyadobacter beijingensis TaxID=365489 RepID=A0ABQ2I162_9BACT|nr:M56 family metallopeptidase [Dyadobacter beijingensis]GGM96640.1 hypothetical protein GCM10010967_32960 [Dyadobacter beijingensis]
MTVQLSNPDFFTWLLSASLAMAILWAAYSYCFRQWTFFTLNRWILLGGTGICLLLPITPALFLGGQFVSESPVTNLRFAIEPMPVWQATLNTPMNGASAPQAAEWLWFSMTVVYWSGVLAMLVRSARALVQLRKIRMRSQMLSRGEIANVWVQNQLPTFSFGKDIFLNVHALSLAPDQLASIQRHEEVHVMQWHTVDNALFEIITAFFWFNPFAKKLSRHLRDVHEFLADRQAAHARQNSTAYQELLVALATSTPAYRIAHPFSDSQFLRRIVMLNKPKTKAMERFKLLLLVPACAAVLLISACMDSTREAPAAPEHATERSISGPVISKITWNGNRLHSDAELGQLLGIKVGEPYDKTRFNERLYKGPLDKSVISLYMDNGYLFFYTDIKEKLVNGRMELTIDISEDEQVWVNNVILTNKSGGKSQTEDIKSFVEVKNGQLFNRSLLIRSQEKLAKSGLVNPDSVKINPYPLPKAPGKKRLVDIEFVVQEP